MFHLAVFKIQSGEISSVIRVIKTRICVTTVSVPMLNFAVETGGGLQPLYGAPTSC